MHTNAIENASVQYLDSSLDTTNFNGKSPINHLLQGLQTINASLASYFLIACNAKGVAGSLVPLEFCL